VLIITQAHACSTDKDVNTTPNEDGISKIDSMKLKISVGERTLTARLDDNPTTRDFIALLPLTVKLDDYASTEKVFYPSRKLSVKNAPSGIDPNAGDITYYAPWGNIAIFYKDFGYAGGLVKIGSIENGIEALQVSGSIDTVRFELIEER